MAFVWATAAATKQKERKECPGDCQKLIGGDGGGEGMSFGPSTVDALGQPTRAKMKKRAGGDRWSGRMGRTGLLVCGARHARKRPAKPGNEKEERREKKRGEFRPPRIGTKTIKFYSGKSVFSR